MKFRISSKNIICSYIYYKYYIIINNIKILYIPPFRPTSSYLGGNLKLGGTKEESSFSILEMYPCFDVPAGPTSCRFEQSSIRRKYATEILPRDRFLHPASNLSAHGFLLRLDPLVEFSRKLNLVDSSRPVDSNDTIKGGGKCSVFVK